MHLLGASLLLLLAGPLTAAAPAPGPTRATQTPQADPAPVDPAVEALRRVVDFHAQIARLSAADLREALNAKRAADPQTAFEALVLRGGLPVTAGLQTVLASERRARQDEALVLLREGLAPSGEEPGHRQRLKDLLESPDTPTVLWAAAARVVGALELYDLAEAVSHGLDEDRSAREHVAAASALHALYLRWFEDRAAFLEAFAQVGEEPPRAFFLTAARDLDRTSLERLERLFQLEPARALERLADPDPRVRRAAANVLASAGGTVDPESALNGLLSRVEVERDPDAFYAQLGALYDWLAEAGVDSKPMRRLRTALQARSNRGNPDLMSAVAQALARLPWLEAAAGQDSLLRGVEMLSDLLSDLVERRELTDGDLLVAVLQALQTLGERADGAGLNVLDSTRPAREALFELLERKPGYEDVRVACAAVVALFAIETDIQALVALLEDDAPTDFTYALLGSLSRLAHDADPTRESSREVLVALMLFVDHPDANLRRRALDLLSGPRLEALTATADVNTFLDRLKVETVGGLSRRLLALIGTHGSPEDLDALIDSPAFEPLAGGSPVLRSELGHALETLVAGDAGRAMRAARRLVESPDPSTRGERLMLALSLVAGFTEEEARRLTPAENEELLAWALELRDYGAITLRATPDGQHFNERLVDLHLAAVLEQRDDPASLAHARALLLGDLLGAGNLITNGRREEEKTRVLASFADALAYADEHPNDLDPDEVRRDRARFLDTMGEARLALADYEALLAARPTPVEAGAEGTPLPATGAGVLDLSDLRRITDLLLATLPEGVDTPSAELYGRTFDLSYTLVHREDWRTQPPSRRVEDLRNLVERATSSADPTRIDLAREVFRTLPDDPAATPPEEPLWQGLTTEPEVLQDLQTLRQGLKEASASGRSSTSGRRPASAAD